MEPYRLDFGSFLKPLSYSKFSKLLDVVVFLGNTHSELVLSRKNIMVRVFLFKTDVVVFLQNNQKDLVLSRKKIMVK